MKLVFATDFLSATQSAVERVLYSINIVGVYHSSSGKHIPRKTFMWHCDVVLNPCSMATFNLSLESVSSILLSLANRWNLQVGYRVGADKWWNKGPITVACYNWPVGVLVGDGLCLLNRKPTLTVNGVISCQGIEGSWGSLKSFLLSNAREFIFLLSRRERNETTKNQYNTVRTLSNQ
jgi:hypothetical protein